MPRRYTTWRQRFGISSAPAKSWSNMLRELRMPKARGPAHGRWKGPNRYELLPGAVARVFLDHGLSTLIDAADLECVLRHHWRADWHASRHHSRCYVVASLWVNGRRKIIYLHRYLLEHDLPETDHRNGDTLDNRRANLRPATAQQNRHGYRQLLPGKSSRYRGVTWDKSRQRWKASLKHQGRSVSRSFASEEDAARWYDEQARTYFGDFATVNFPVMLH